MGEISETKPDTPFESPRLGKKVSSEDRFFVFNSEMASGDNRY
jgi:hypothetical protein